jgi:SIR2-like domain
VGDQKDLLAFLAERAQACFSQVPAIVLGSGASAAHRIRGMVGLSDYLKASVAPSEQGESEAWTSISASLDAVGLEQALQQTASPANLVSQIVLLTHRILAEDDLALLSRIVHGEEKLHLANTLSGLSRTTKRTISVVTTNYDRIAEYACDVAGLAHWTGFTPGYIRRRDGSAEVSLFRGGHQQQLVQIFKVHGSLDWYCDPAGTPIGLPPAFAAPDGFEPLIVTPGVSKYQRTHHEPFRSTIQGSDRALAEAASFLCIGYGFRDEHIQPRLLERCARANVPVVVLARTLTEEARAFVSKSAGDRYLALEHHNDGSTAYFPGQETGVVIEGVDLWSLEGFNKLIM